MVNSIAIVAALVVVVAAVAAAVDSYVNFRSLLSSLLLFLFLLKIK